MYARKLSMIWAEKIDNSEVYFWLLASAQSSYKRQKKRLKIWTFIALLEQIIFQFFHRLFSACANPQMGGLLIGTITPRGEGGNQANVVQ